MGISHQHSNSQTFDILQLPLIEEMIDIEILRLYNLNFLDICNECFQN